MTLIRKPILKGKGRRFNKGMSLKRIAIQNGFVEKRRFDDLHEAYLSIRTRLIQCESELEKLKGKK
jgi:hypothetical protein